MNESTAAWSARIAIAPENKSTSERADPTSRASASAAAAAGENGGRSSRKRSSLSSFMAAVSCGPCRRASAPAPKRLAGKPQRTSAEFADGSSLPGSLRSRRTHDQGGIMAVRVAINGFGRTGRAAFRAAVESGADIEWVADQRRGRSRDARPAAQVRHRLRAVRRQGRGRRRRDRRQRRSARDTDGARPGAAAVGRARRRRRDRVHRALPRPRRRREASRGRREEGDRVGARQGAGRHRRARRQLRDVRPRCGTTSSRTRRARRTAWHRWRRCCTTRSASATA